MTISTEDTVVVSTVTLDVPIALPFPVHAGAEVQVYDKDGELALLNVDYQVQLFAPAFDHANVIPKAGLVTKAEGQNVVILRVLPNTQPTQVYSANQILAAELQKALDRAAMRDQQLDEKISRSILRPIVESDETPWTLPSAADRANKALGFDGDGNLLPIGQISSLIELEEALADIAQAVEDANDAADAAAGSSGAAAGSAGAAAGSANNAALAANNAAESAADAVQTLEDIQDYVAGLGSFTRRKFSGFTPGQTVLPIPGGFTSASTMMVFFDSSLLDLGGEYTAVSPNITLTEPITSADQEITLIEFVAVSITDALIKTQNLADLTDKKTARVNMELTKVQNVGNADETILAGTRVVYTTLAFTAARAFALPAANAYNPGETLDVLDLAGAISGANTATLNRAGADTINGANSVTISNNHGGLRLVSDGSSKWTFAVPTPPVALNGTLVGETKLWNGPRLPSLYQWEDGAAISRTTYSDLLNAITLVATGTSTASSPTITAIPEDLRGLGLVGAKIEGLGIQANTTITAIAATTITLSQNASSTVTLGTFRVFPHGNGNGSTTFNKPDGRGRADVGRDDMGGTAATRLTATGTGNPGLDGTVLGAAAGSDRHQLTLAQMPSHTHSYLHPTLTTLTVGGTNFYGASDTTQNSGSAGSDQAHPNVQPSIVRNKIIFAGA